MYLSYAECLYKLGELDAAYRASARSLALPDQDRIHDEPARAAVLLLRSFIELDLDRADTCLASIAQAEAILERVAPDDVLVGTALNIRASALAHRGDLRDALKTSDAAARFFAQRLGRRAEECIFARQSSGELAHRLGQLAQARDLLTGAVEDARATFGERDPRLAYAEHALAAVLLELHQRAAARQLLEHGVAVLTQAEDETPHAAQLHATLARLLVDEQPERARQLATRALDAWQGQGYWSEEYLDLKRWLQQQRRLRPVAAGSARSVGVRATAAAPRRVRQPRGS